MYCVSGDETQKRDEAIQAYYNTEGWVDGTYNWIKELFDSGLTREDIDEYLKNEKTLNTMLQASLQNGGSLQIVESKIQDGQISKETIKNVVTDRLSGFDNSKDILIYAKEQLGLTDEELIPIIRESLIDSPLYANLDIANPDLARVVWDEENQDYRVFWNNEDDTGALLSDKYHSNNGRYTTKFLYL